MLQVKQNWTLLNRKSNLPVLQPPSLPRPFNQSAGQIWGEVDGETLYNCISSAYEVVIYWKANLFIPLHGSTGGQAFAQGSSAKVHCYDGYNNYFCKNQAGPKNHMHHLPQRLDFYRRDNAYRVA